jgi:hypothetical protein
MRSNSEGQRHLEGSRVFLDRRYRILLTCEMLGEKEEKTAQAKSAWVKRVHIPQEPLPLWVDKEWTCC